LHVLRGGKSQPTMFATKVILNDILAGERTLQKLRAAEDKDLPAEKPSRGRNKPFTVNPVRTFRKVEVA
jgi:hypothetical protein